MLTRFYTILVVFFLALSSPLMGVVLQNQTIKQDSFVVDEALVNNGDITVSSLLVDADFKNRQGFVTADKVLVTASCNTFENNNVLQVSDSLTFVDPKTVVTMSIMTRVKALYKGDDYMGGIDCWFGKKNKGTLTITNREQTAIFEGSASEITQALNKGLNETSNVTALIAYLRQALVQKNVVAAALRNDRSQ